MKARRSKMRHQQSDLHVADRRWDLEGAPKGAVLSVKGRKLSGAGGCAGAAQLFTYCSYTYRGIFLALAKEIIETIFRLLQLKFSKIKISC